MSEVAKLLQELIRIDTTNPPGNETRAAELLRDYLEDSGVTWGHQVASAILKRYFCHRMVGDSIAVHLPITTTSCAFKDG